MSICVDLFFSTNQLNFLDPFHYQRDLVKVTCQTQKLHPKALD